MVWKVICVAVFAAVAGPYAAQAQSLAQIGGPAELPPNSFSGDQYVDSRGCVFLRAGNGGRLNWVPRVTRARKVLCGFPPTLGPRPAIDVADDIVPETVAPAMAAKAPAAPKPPAAVVATPVRNVGLPMETIASLPEMRKAAPAPLVTLDIVRAPAPAVRAAPSQTYEIAASTGVPAGKVGCYTDAPVPQRVTLRNGGTALVCTRGDGTLSGWRPPVYPDGARVGASLANPPVEFTTHRAGQTGHSAPAPAYTDASNPAPVMPKGYKAAWTDDRLNPNRGRGTAEGQAAQDQIWTRDVPAQLVTDTARKKAKKSKTTSVSTSNAATETGAAIWVQVGTFGVAANATGAAQKLAAMGLPTAKSKISRGGKSLQIVLAGPFGSTADAKAALAMARNAGFGDAILR